MHEQVEAGKTSTVLKLKPSGDQVETFSVTKLKEWNCTYYSNYDSQKVGIVHSITVLG